MKISDVMVKAKQTIGFAGVKKIALVGIVSTAITSTVNAAVNLTPISDLITAINGLVPSIVDLVINLLPLAVVGIIVVFLKKVFSKAMNY